MKNGIKTQVFVGMALLILTLIWALNIDTRLALYLISGLMIGYALTRSRFGYAGGVKRLYMTGDTSLTTALFVMFIITSIGVAGIQFMAVKTGISGEGINFMKSVKPLDIGVIVGGFLFGSGMIISGGCASGTLTDLGEGALRAFITYIFYILGAPIGHALRVWLENSELKKVAVKVYFPDYFGYVGAVVVTALIFLFMYYFVDKYKKKRIKENTLIVPEYDDIEKELDTNVKKGFFSYETYHKIFIQRWSFLTGSLVISIIFLFIFVTSGKAWGVTSSFTVNGVWLLQKFGMDFSQYAGFEKIVKQAADITKHAGTLRNTATVLGATIAFLLAGRFRFDYKFTLKDALIYALGGLFMGIGARFARGCNVGALYAAITNFSLHGWGFMLFMIIGAIIALKLFEGKVNIIPKRKGIQ